MFFLLKVSTFSIITTELVCWYALCADNKSHKNITLINIDHRIIGTWITEHFVLSTLSPSEHHQRGQQGFLEMKMLSLLVNQFMDANVANLIEKNTTI